MNSRPKQIPTRLAILTILIGLLLTACAETDPGVSGTTATTTGITGTTAESNGTASSNPEENSSAQPNSSDPDPDQTNSGSQQDSVTSTTPTPTTVPSDQVSIPDDLVLVTSSWETDFSIATVDLEELKVGIPASDPRDRIPPIDEPNFEPVDQSSWLADREPGVLVSQSDEARFYPLTILHRHEIVNDQFPSGPITVTYCPLCNTALAFSPIVNGQKLRFGVSGLLRNSDLVMWDDVTESLWQQITGEAIVGELAGTKLIQVGSAIVSYGDFVDRYPSGQVMTVEQGFGIPYGTNPYIYYSSGARPYNFFDREIDDRYPALSRVVGVSIGAHHKAYPFTEITEVRVVNDQLGDTSIVVLWGSPDTADALDNQVVADSEGVGTGLAYSAEVAGQTLTFNRMEDDRFEDQQTGTTWSLLGVGLDGPLAGTQLELVPHRNEFWFAWQAFFPDAPVWVAPA